MQERRTSVAAALASRSSRQLLVRKGIVVDLSENQIRIRDLQTQVQALKGELEQQAANHHRDMEDRVSTASKKAQEANLEFASQARNIHKQRERHLKEKQTLESKLSRSLLDQIKKRSGKFYDDVSRALAATMAEEGVVKARELQQQLAVLEEQLNAAQGELNAAQGEHRLALDQQKKLLESQAKEERAAQRLLFDERLDARVASLTEEHNAMLRQRHNEGSTKHSQDLDAIQRDWASKWSEREREYLEGELSWKRQSEEELEKLKMDYQQQKNNQDKQHRLALKERDRRDLSLLQEKLDELSRAREELDTDRLAQEKDSAMKYSKALDAAKEQDRASRVEMNNVREREIEALNLSINEERKMYIDSRAQMELAHAREITALRSLVDDERTRARETSTRFEDELERKFAMLAEGLEEQVRWHLDGTCWWWFSWCNFQYRPHCEHPGSDHCDSLNVYEPVYFFFI